MRFKQLLCLIALFIGGNTFAAKLVHLGTLEWPPYIAKDVDGKGNQGYVYDVIVEAFKRSGYEAKIKFYPWARALQLTKEGKNDGLFPEYEVVVDWGVLSAPYQGGPVGLYKRKDLDVKYSVDPKEPTQTQALEALKDYKFGVVKGYTNTTAFDNATFLKKFEAVSDEQNLKKLYFKRGIDLIFVDKFVAKYILNTPENQKMNDALEFLEPPMEEKPLFIQFSKKAKDYEAKIEAFNKGLAEIKKDGTMEKILAKYGF